MTLVNKITETGYDTAFTASDDANVYENYNYSGGNADGVLQSVYRYFQDHERRRNLNCVYRGFSASINGTDIEIARESWNRRRRSCNSWKSCSDE